MGKDFPRIFKQNFEPKLLKEIKRRPVMKAKAGEDIMIEGMHVEYIPLVLEGRIELYKIAENNKEAHIYDVNPGESCVITYTTVERGREFPARARAVEDTKIILIDKETSDKWFRKYRTWRNFILWLYDLRMNELIEVNKETTVQKEEIEKKNEEIISSIKYASRIQKALLPEHREISMLVPEYFVMFRPRDIVSGDFYWVKKIGDRIFITVADATGHGVPGGFMSALGLAFIRETAESFRGNAAEFLNILRQKVIDALRKYDEKETLTDGMDMSLMILYPQEKKADFAGAYNSIFLWRQGKLFEVKGDKMPIGKFYNEHSFSNKEIELEDGDMIYFYSDGYYSQLGGGKGHKFMKKNFRKLLEEVAPLPLEKQKQILEQRFDEWKGDGRQTDDVTVMGIKLTLQE